MRQAVKYRLLFLLIAIVSYSLGIKFLPETLSTAHDWRLLYLFSALFFVILPTCYWYCIINKGKQKLWKMLLVFSLSAFVARMSFPTQLADYFEFITWLRYPLLAVLIAFELYLMVSVIRGLWQARKAKGDPRLSALNLINASNNKQELPADDDNSVKAKLADKVRHSKKESMQTLTLTLAAEPASWYYAIPYLSRNHVPAIAQLNTKSAQLWHILLVVSGLLFASVISYQLLAGFSEIGAIFVSGLCVYSLIFSLANFRVARYFSIYQQQNQLVVSVGMMSLLAIEQDNIQQIELVGEISMVNKEDLVLGNRSEANLKLTFKQAQTYFGMMGALPEEVTHLYLSAKEPEKLITHLQVQVETLVSR
ncbi:MAG: hypothetical protein ACPGUD_14890 [Parashewanella sp.]